MKNQSFSKKIINNMLLLMVSFFFCLSTFNIAQAGSTCDDGTWVPWECWDRLGTCWIEKNTCNTWQFIPGSAFTTSTVHFWMCEWRYIPSENLSLDWVSCSLAFYPTPPIETSNEDTCLEYYTNNDAKNSCGYLDYNTEQCWENYYYDVEEYCQVTSNDDKNYDDACQWFAENPKCKTGSSSDTTTPTATVSTNSLDISTSPSWSNSVWNNSNINGTISVTGITTFSWVTWAWSECNATCGGGEKTRTVVCRWSNGDIYSDSICSWAKPATTAPCNNDPCVIPIIDCVAEYNDCDSCKYTKPPTGGSWFYPSTKSCTLTSTTTPASGWGAVCPATISKTCTVWKNSFIEGTQVILSNGNRQNIETIQVWDKLKWSNNSINTVLELKFHPHQWDLYAINGNEYFVTPGHPFMTLNGWKAFDEQLAMEINPTLSIKKLHQWDILVKKDGLEVIQFISKINVDIQVYNFEVSWTRDYYANWYLVHNK